MSAATALRHYIAHSDPATAAANLVALVVGSNGPFYPLYVWLLVGHAGPMLLWTMLASPFFLAIPWLSRRSGAAARAALPLIGIANTLFCAALLGSQSGLVAFLMPCLVLAGFLWRERAVLLLLLGIGLVAQQLLLRWHLPGWMGLDADEGLALLRLNAGSAGLLLGFIALVLANLLKAEARPRG